MSTATDFIGSVYDTLAKAFGINSSSTDTFLQMAWPGYSLSPTDFKPPSAPNGPYDPGIAEETFSALANIEPTLNKVRFENSGFEIDDLYEILILSAIPVGANPDNIGTNPLHKLFNDAQFEFSNFRRGSKVDPNTFYYPVVATPNNWYDEAAAQSWPTVDIKSGDIKPPAPSSVFTTLGGLSLANQAIWKLKPAAVNEQQLRTTLQTSLVSKNNLVKQKIKTKPGVVNTKPLNATMSTAAMATQPTAFAAHPIAFATPAMINTSAFANAMAASRTKAIFTTKNAPVSSFDNLVTTSKLNNVVINKDLLQVKATANLNVGQAIGLQDILNQQLVTKPLSPATNGFSISFKYCRVNMDRNWMNLALLNMRNWYMFETSKSEYSTGTIENNTGMFPLLPTSFIVIRDLKITANWSQEDKDNFGNALSFGPFDIRNGTFNQNTITVKGLQVISWISKLMPALPPAQV